MASRTLVMKFGGTSVGTAQAMRQVVQIIAATRADWPRLVVVVSALSGVTDQLLAAGRDAVQGRDALAQQPHGPAGGLYGQPTTFRTPHSVFSHALRRRHTELAYAVVTPSRLPDGSAELEQAALPPDPAGEEEEPAPLYPPPPPLLAPLLAELNALLDDFEHLCQAVGVLGEASPRALDAIASLGERLSARILAAALQAGGIPAQAVDATRLVVTDARFTNATPDLAATSQRARLELEPLLEHGLLPVVTGFLGATPQGITTTLGRGGSDTSASILALALGAEEVWIWTDVDGVMTADPRLVPGARTIPVLSYREVAEMAYFGAKVLHPRSIYPALEAGIPLRVRNTFNPAGPETCLVPEHPSNGRGHIKAVSAIRGLQMVTLSGRGMLGVPGVAGRIFTAAATTGVSIPIIIESTSEQSIAFAAPLERVPDVLSALHRDLQAEFERGDIDAAEASQEVCILTLICPGIRSTVGIAGRIFGALAGAAINVQAISYGSSDYSIGLVVAAGDLSPAINALHALVE